MLLMLGMVPLAVRVYIAQKFMKLLSFYVFNVTLIYLLYMDLHRYTTTYIFNLFRTRNEKGRTVKILMRQKQNNSN